MTTLPSEARPAGLLKYVIPKGLDCAGNAAQKPPVSELESPKLKMAPISHLAALKGIPDTPNTQTTMNFQSPTESIADKKTCLLI